MNPRLQGLGPAATQHVMIAGQALDAGRVAEADQHLSAALAAYPDHPEVLRMKAGVHSLRGEHQDAIRVMQRALTQRPQDPLYYNTRGSLLGSSGEFEAAIQALRRSCELQPGLALAWYNLGIMLTKCVRNEEAVEALHRAVALAPDHVAARALLADLLRTRGRVTEAAAEYRTLIAKHPAAGTAWWGLADLKAQRFSEEDVAQMRAALQRPEASEHDRTAIGFALAKALDDAGRYDESLRALATANTIARRQQTWNASAFSNSVAAISSAFEPAPQGAADSLGHEVIFIVSLPRSGSTLTEQILAAHPLVEGASELGDVSAVLREESDRRGIDFPFWIGQASAEDWARLGRNYLARTARWRRNRPRSTDKMPNNWLFVGAIMAMLPGARIVNCRRDPVETCWSCYKQMFSVSNEFSYDLDYLARFWQDYDYAMRQWHLQQPGRIRDQVYEELVANPESEVRALLDYCGLPFDETCLRFYEVERSVRTASAAQVRQPLRRNTARSAGYGALLDPLRLSLARPRRA